MTRRKKMISRRKILQGAAAAAAFPLIVDPHVLGRGQAAAPSNTLNVATIGVGNQGRFNTRNAARAGANVVAICDVDEEQAAEMAKDFPKAKIIKDFRELLEKEKGVDAVMIATPDHSHAAIAVAAMEMGKPVYCEKPLAHTVYECRKMAEVARDNKVATQMGNQGRSFHSIKEFSECIWSGAIGEVREIHCVQNSSGYSRLELLPGINDDHAAPKGLDWDTWIGGAKFRGYNPAYHPGKWRGWTAFGGGNMGDFVCHIVDPVFLALKLGAPDSVVAEAQGYDPIAHGETFPRSTKVTFKFPARGRRPAVTLTWYDGDVYKPPHPAEVKEGEDAIPSRRPGRQVGAIVVGDKGKIAYGSHGARDWRILGEGKMAEYMGDRKRVPEPSEPGPPPNKKHLAEWLSACKGWKVANSNFDYGAPLAEIAMLGNIAIRMLGTELRFDSRNMTFPNQPEANQYLHTQYRDGWSL